MGGRTLRVGGAHLQRWVAGQHALGIGAVVVLWPIQVGPQWCRHPEKQVAGDGPRLNHGVVAGKEPGRHVNWLREQKRTVLIEHVAKAALGNEHVGIRVEVLGEQVH